MANFVVSSRSHFARNSILVENNSFRSSPLTRSGGTLVVSAKKILRKIHFLRNKLLFLYVNKFIMNTKLTLNLDKGVIEQAKSYAKNNSVSLSKLIENYLDSLTKRSEKKSNVSPLVESLTGVIPSGNYDDKKDYKDYLSGKYS